MENVPTIIGAPSRSSSRVVKFTCPCLTCTTCLLPLPLLFLLEDCPGKISWAKDNSSKVCQATAIETMIVVACAVHWWSIGPRASMLLLLLLLRIWRFESSLLLRRPKNQSACWCITLRSFRWSILHQTISRRLRARGCRRCFPLLFGTMCRDTIVLGNGHID